MKSLLKILCTVFLALSSAGGAEGARMKISVPANAVVSSQNVTLGDIAAMEGGDKETLVQLQSLPLPALSSSARTRTLGRGMIAAAMKRNRIDVEEIELDAPDTITVSLRMMTVKAQEIEEKAREYLEESFRQKAGEAAVTGVICESGDLSLPRGEWEITFPPLNRAPGSGTIHVYAHVLVDGVLAEKVRAKAQVEMSEATVVAAKTLEKGSILSPSDFTMEKKVVDRENPNLLKDPDQIVGKQITRRIVAGSSIQENMLASLPLIKKKDRVKIVLESKFLRISTVGIANEDGSMGSYIQVMNLDSEKMIVAKVIGENLVKVEF